MAKPYIRDLIPGDIEYVGTRVCSADVRAMSVTVPDRNPLEVLTLSVAQSHRVWAAAVDDIPLGIFGVVAYTADIGQPWMMCTEETFRHPRAMLVLGRQYVTEMCKEFGLLLNYVDARNHALQKWLEHLGFEFSEPEPFGPYGVLFHLFQMRTEACASPPLVQVH